MFSNSHFQFQTQVKRAADGAGREVVLANPGLVEARWQDTHTHHYADDADYADDDDDDDADYDDDDGVDVDVGIHTLIVIQTRSTKG